jgi:hypothetical protein
VLTPAGDMISTFARGEQERLLSFIPDLRHGVSKRPVVFCAGNGVTFICWGRSFLSFQEIRPIPSASLRVTPKKRMRMESHFIIVARRFGWLKK